jgi:hypothetical protein
MENITLPLEIVVLEIYMCFAHDGDYAEIYKAMTLSQAYKAMITMSMSQLFYSPVPGYQYLAWYWTRPPHARSLRERIVRHFGAPTEVIHNVLDNNIPNTHNLLSYDAENVKLHVATSLSLLQDIMHINHVVEPKILIDYAVRLKRAILGNPNFMRDMTMLEPFVSDDELSRTLNTRLIFLDMELAEYCIS